MLFYIRLVLVYLNTLSPRWSSDEQRDVDDIDVSDVESDPEEDFDSEGIDEETVKVHVLTLLIIITITH